MARMTEEEAWALDGFVTNNEIELGPNGSGWLSQREMRLMGLSMCLLITSWPRRRRTTKALDKSSMNWLARN